MIDHQIAEFKVIDANGNWLGSLTVSGNHVVRITGNAKGYWKRSMTGYFATLAQLVDFLQSLDTARARREFGASLPFTLNDTLNTEREEMFAKWWPLIVEALRK